MRIGKQALRRCTSGQALLETALVLPLLLALIFNAINFGYFFLVALNVSAAPRSGVLYSILGSASPGGPVLPNVKPSIAPSSDITTVSYLTYSDMIGALATPTGASIQICSKVLGVASNKANCVTCTGFNTACSAAAAGSGALAPDADPEPTQFVLNRVDVTYSFKPIIPGTPFGIALMPSTICSGGTCTFHRQVSMRAMD